MKRIGFALAVMSLLVLAACEGRRRPIEGVYECRDGAVVYVLGETVTPVVRPPSREDLCQVCGAWQAILDANNEILANPNATPEQQAQATAGNEVARRHLDGCRECRCDQ